MTRQMLGLLALLVVSDTVAAAVGAYALYPLRNTMKLARYMGIFLVCVFCDQTSQLIAFTGRSNGIAWMASWWWFGRIIHCIGIWVLTAYLIRGSRNSN
jgi:arginine exporter protein ArgO